MTIMKILSKQKICAIRFKIFSKILFKIVTWAEIDKK